MLALKMNEFGGHKMHFQYPIDVIDGFTVFTVVRHPVPRFLSSYNFAMSKKTYWHDRDRNPFPQYDLLKDMTMHDIIDSLLEDEFKVIAHWGWRHQYPFMFDKYDKLCVDYVLKQETLQNDFDAMMVDIGMERIQLPSSNVSDLVIDKIEDESLIAKIKDFYKKDYALLGYA